MMSNKKMAVIGIGAIGRGVVQCYALAGFDVWAVTRNGEDKMTPYLQREVNRGRLTQEQADLILSRTVSCTLEELPEVELVIEAIIELIEEKQVLFRHLDETQPVSTVLATSTSTLPISEISKTSTHKERMIGMHFSTPVPKMGLVEVIKSVFTSEEVLARTREYCEVIDKIPAVVKDFPGFVLSRLAQAMINEAGYILMQGIADAETIDLIATKGLNVPTGPLKLIDETGIDVGLRGIESMHRLLNDPRYAPSPVFRQKVYDGHIGRKAGRGFYNYED
jgi:3-hydroxybutyryl-CoA dehydrogenase